MVEVCFSWSMVVIFRVVPLTTISRISPAFAMETSSFRASSLGSSAGGESTMTRMKASNAMAMSRIMLFLDMFNFTTPFNVANANLWTRIQPRSNYSINGRSFKC